MLPVKHNDFLGPSPNPFCLQPVIIPLSFSDLLILFLTVTGCCDFCANKHSTKDQKLLAYKSIWRHGTHAISYFWDIKVPQVCWLLGRSSNPYFHGYTFSLLLSCCLHTVGWFNAKSLYSLDTSSHQVKVVPMWMNLLESPLLGKWGVVLNDVL